MTTNDWVPIAISITALIFVIFSFWWMHWRKGQLIVSVPRSFRLAKTQDRLIVELPLSFFNTGAASIIVDNLLLMMQQHDTKVLLFFNATRHTLDATQQQFATQFVVNGRNSIFNIFSFQVKGNTLNLNTGKCDCYLSGKLDSRKYKRLLNFQLDIKQISAALIPYDNYDDEYQTMTKMISDEK